MKTFKAKLTFARTEYDDANMWTKTKQVEVELPECLLERNGYFGWHLIGMEDWNEKANRAIDEKAEN